MHKPFLSCVISLLSVMAATAQSSGTDRTKVLDFFQNQQFEEAISYLQPAVENDSANLQVLGFLGYAYYMTENMRAAEQCYLKMFSIDSNHITANHYLAVIYSGNELEQAQQFTARLIRLQPGKALYYRNMGELWARRNQKDSALTYYRQAYAIAPNDSRIIAGLAEVLIMLKDYPPADSLLEMGLAKDSLQLAYLKLYIRSAYETKNYERVIEPGETLVRLQDITLNPLTKLILSYYNLKKYTDCIRICDYMTGLGIDLESVNYYAARSWAQLKDYAKSNELLEDCLGKAISKTAEMYYYALGQNYEATKEWKKAVAAYDTGYYLFKSPLMMYNCGRIYEVELKNEPLARRYYVKYLATAKPEAADEKKAYQYVKKTWGTTKRKK
jgi:tetratricopeptide (TPR) repeat protein